MRESLRFALPFWMSMALVIQSLPVALLAGPAWAQAAGEQAEAEPVMRLVWRGTQRESYQQSRTAALLAETQLGQSLASGWSAIAKMAEAEGEPAMADALDGPLGELLRVGWSRPMALGVSDFSGGGPTGDTPVFQLTWDLGDAGQAQRLADELRALPASAKPDAPAFSAKGGRLRIGEATGDPFAGFTVGDAAMSDMTRDAQLVAMLDVAGLIARISEQAPAGQSDMAMQWVEALGLKGVGSVAYVGRFDERGWWHYRYLIESPAPRKGLMRLFDAEPLGPEAMREVPASATWAGAYRLDPARLLTIVREAAREIDEQYVMQLDGMLGMASGMTGVDLEQALLGSLGDTWVAYHDTSAVGPVGMGLCVVNRARDPQQLAAAVDRLQTVVQSIANQQIEANEPGTPFRLNFQTQEVAGLTLHSINMFFMSPSWAVVDDRFVLGLQPQAVVAAAGAIEREGSLAESEAFAEVAGAYADRPLTGLRYMNLPESGPATYSQLVSMSQIAASLSSMTGEDAPIMVMPPLHQVTPYLAPAGEAAWVDDSGVYVEGRLPFVGASLFSPYAGLAGGGGAGGVATTSLLVGILLPALGAARRTARQMQSNTQLRGIHQSTIMWAQTNDGRLSHDVGELLLGNFFTAEYLLSPASGKSVPAGFGNWPDDQKARWARENTDFFLLPNKTETLDPEEVAGFSDPSLTGGDLAVVYGDNHTVWETELGRIEQLIREQTGLTLEQIIEMQRTGDWSDAPSSD